MTLMVLAGSHGPVTPVLLDLVQRLLPLGGWEPVGAMLETARMALAGEDGLTAKELERMRRWAMRWEALHPKVANFYLQHVVLAAHSPPHRDAYRPTEHALFRVLEGGVEIDGAVIGRLHELWEAWDGSRCPYSIAPVRRNP